MKFEEVLALIREGKTIEDFEHQVLSSGIWAPFSTETFTTWGNLIKKEFRLRIHPKQKIKRYQIIFTTEERKKFYTTHPNNKYTAQEFKDKCTEDERYLERYFHAIIPESVEEFDE